ncbi:hypothetical protein HDV03_004412 [Kappamyces sp. JEL0829]|nr:hypothetical protein HDV03_004412 [Kappamyces sp. JEL0829]
MQENFPTPTSKQQQDVEQIILTCAAQAKSEKLKRASHERFLLAPLTEGLNRWFVTLDASKPWLVYWILQSLDLLDIDMPLDVKERSVETLMACQHSEGGFSGGKGQLAHLATTYAAVNALAIIGTESAFQCIDREKMYAFLMRMKQPDGSFRMHEDGEIDIRGSYCALTAAILLNIVTPELVEGVAEFIVGCQSFDGGLAPFPGVEAHGGYTFCGLATMCVLKKLHLLDTDMLLQWIVDRQMEVEGGFQGRTNKLVDGCYSFWQGCSAVLIESYFKTKVEIFNRNRLAEYIYKCCQAPGGGLRDKPGKSPDYYHSCYCLSGLSICQHTFEFCDSLDELAVQKIEPVYGGAANALKATHPVHNIALERVRNIRLYFRSLEPR